MSFGGKSQSTTDQKLNSIQLTQSSYGTCVPLVYGMVRIAPSLLWYGNFKATPHTEKTGGKGGGGGATHTSYSYSAALVMMLSEGQIYGTSTVWADKSQTTLAALGFTLFNGAGPQSIWSYLTTNFPSQAIPYDRTAYVANGSFELGSGAALPNLSFEVQGLLPYNPGSGIFDAEPGAFLNDYTTNVHHGCNFPYLDGPALSLYSDYCIAMGFFLSPAEKEQRQAAEFIKGILKITNSNCVWSAGKLKIIPYADQPVTGNGKTYTPNLTPLYAFGDDDYMPDDGIEPVRVSRKAPSETFNVVRVEYTDRANQYNTGIAEAKDEQDIIVRGERVMPTIKFAEITDKAVARQVAQLILQRQLYVVNGYQWEARIDYCLLEPMDYVSLTDTGLGFSNKLVRLTLVNDDEEDRLHFEAEEVLVGTAGAPRYNWQDAQGFAANYNTAPGSVQTPYIIAGPPLLIDVGGGYEIWIAIGGPNGSSMWGGCDVYMSLDGGTRYEMIGQVRGGARYGTLTATLASGSDPDSTNTLSVLLNDTNKTLISGSASDADQMRTPIYVDGEIMSYQTATLTGPGAYNLTYLRRGRYGSTISSHVSGASFIRLDDSIVRIPFDPGMIGQTVRFKFPSFNIYGGGLEDVASVPSYSYTVAPNNALMRVGAATLVARGSCFVSGNTISKATSAATVYDSDCYSIEAYSAGCVVKFRCATDGRSLAGLNSDPLTDQNYTSLDYCWYMESGGTARIYESGTSIGAVGTYTASTVFSITYDGIAVRYYLDGVLKREVQAPGRVFFFDSSFYAPGDTLTDVYFGALNSQPASRLNARGNCIVVGNSIQKQGGSGAWDSDCYSTETFPGGCAASFRFPAHSAIADLIVGLNSDPTTDQNYTSIDYCFELYFNGSAYYYYIYESGTQIVNATAAAANDVYAIKYDGQWVRYYRNGALVREKFDPDRTFFLDSSFYRPGTVLADVQFGPLTSATPSPFIARGNCKVSDNNVIKQGGSPARDSDFYSIIGYPTCHVSWKHNGIPSGGQTDLLVGLSTDPASSVSYTNINYSIDNYNSGATKTWAIYESGVAAGVSGNWTESTIFAITYDGTNVRYYVDGVNVLTRAVSGLTLFAKSSFAHPGEGINTLRFGPTTNLALTDTYQINNYAVTDAAVTTIAADGSQAYTAGTQPRIEGAGLSAVASYTAPAATSAQVDVDWQGQARISNTTSGVAVGEARLQVSVYINGSLNFQRWLVLEPYTAASDWGAYSGSLTFLVPAGQTIDVYLQTLRNFSTSGSSPAQTMFWRSAAVNLLAKKR